MKFHFKDLFPTAFLLVFMIMIAASPPASWQPPHHDDTFIGIGTDDEPLGVNTDTIHVAPVYSARINQATTAAPTAYRFINQYTGTAPVWTRDSIGTYKMTKTACCLDSTLIIHFTINSGTAFTSRAYRATDSTLIVKLKGQPGIGVDLGGTASIDIWRYLD